MKQLSFLLFAVLMFLPANIFAQSPNKILKQAEKALGGKKALRKSQSSYKSGKITRIRDGATGSYTSLTMQPNYFRESFELDGFEIESGHNGRSGWRRDSREGTRTLTGDESRDFQAEAAFRNDLWLDYKKNKSKAVYAGQSKIGGKNANRIDLTTAKGTVIKLFFDSETDFLIREEMPAGNQTKRTDYADYRSVGQIKEPFRLRVTQDGGEIYEIQLDEARRDPLIAESNFDFPNISGQPLPDIVSLLKQLQANEDEVEKILDNYSYTQKIIKRELGKDGVLREIGSETFQLSFYKGFRIRRLVEKDAKPLSGKDQADEDRQVQKRVAEIEEKIAKQEAKAVEQSAVGTPEEEGRRVSIAEVLRASNLINPRRERFRGRDVIVFDFEPNPDFDYKNAKSFLKFFGKTAGVMWIDEKDKQVARIEAILFDSYKVGGGLLANLKKGATFTLEQTRINDEIWLPSSADINLSLKVLLFKGININQVIRSYNYRKFATEVKGSEIENVSQPD